MNLTDLGKENASKENVQDVFNKTIDTEYNYSEKGYKKSINPDQLKDLIRKLDYMSVEDENSKSSAPINMLYMTFKDTKSNFISKSMQYSDSNSESKSSTNLDSGNGTNNTKYLSSSLLTSASSTSGVVVSTGASTSSFSSVSTSPLNYRQNAYQNSTYEQKCVKLDSLSSISDLKESDEDIMKEKRAL